METSKLYNIATGKCVSDQIADCLLGLEKTGCEKRELFIEECAKESKRFEKPIKRNRLYTFKMLLQKAAVKKNGKLIQIANQRDLFGLLLSIAIDYKINLLVVLSFPLTKYPTTMCDPDGTICKTTKSVLTQVLEGLFETAEYLEAPDLIIYDGFALLYTLKNVPLTFGEISERILKYITTNHARRIDLLFDTYPTLSLKRQEHVIRGSYETTY